MLSQQSKHAESKGTYYFWYPKSFNGVLRVVQGIIYSLPLSRVLFKDEAGDWGFRIGRTLHWFDAI